MTGAAYAAIITTLMSLILALLLGIVKGRPNVEQIGSHLLLNVFVTAPVLALTLGTIALGIGAIIGAASMAARSVFFAGLEWSIVGGIGVAVGFGARYPRWNMALVAFAAGSIIGGIIGVLTWLRHYTASRATFGRRAVLFCAVAIILTATYTYFTAWWCISFLG
jgi:hypothetical protein